MDARTRRDGRSEPCVRMSRGSSARLARRLQELGYSPLNDRIADDGIRLLGSARREDGLRTIVSFRENQGEVEFSASVVAGPEVPLDRVAEACKGRSFEHYGEERGFSLVFDNGREEELVGGLERVSAVVSDALSAVLGSASMRRLLSSIRRLESMDSVSESGGRVSSAAYELPNAEYRNAMAELAADNGLRTAMEHIAEEPVVRAA